MELIAHHQIQIFQSDETKTDEFAIYMFLEKNGVKPVDVQAYFNEVRYPSLVKS